MIRAALDVMPFDIVGLTCDADPGPDLCSVISWLLSNMVLN